MRKFALLFAALFAAGSSANAQNQKVATLKPPPLISLREALVALDRPFDDGGQVKYYNSGNYEYLTGSKGTGSWRIIDKNILMMTGSKTGRSRCVKHSFDGNFWNQTSIHYEC